MSRTLNWSLSFLAIQSKRWRLIAQRIGPVGSANQIPTDEEQTPVVREKAKQAIGDPNGFSIRYNQFFPKNRTVSRRVIPAVKGRVAERAFSDEDFLCKWKVVSERPCYEDLAENHTGPPMNELAAPIKVADVAALIASLKESFPGPDGLHLSILWGIPIEVITILYNLLLLKGPLPTSSPLGDTVKAGFSSTGLCPFNPSAIVLPERPQVGSITSASTSDDHQPSGFMLQTSTFSPLPQTSTSSSPFPQTTSSPLPLTPIHCPLLQASTSGHQLQHSTGYQTMGAVSSPSPVLSLGLKDFFLKQLQPRFSMSTGRSARVQRFRYGESLTSEESLKRAREAAEAKEAATTRERGKGKGKGKGRGKQTKREESPCNSNRSRSPVSSDNEECKRCGQSGGNNWIQCDICDSWYHTRLAQPPWVPPCLPVHFYASGQIRRPSMEKNILPNGATKKRRDASRRSNARTPCPLNIAMDQILEGQEEYAFSIGAFVLNQMAYADDLILFASSPDEMQKRIDRLLVGLGKLGLELNALKCRVLCIRGNKKRKFCYVDTSVSVLVDGVALPVVTAESEFKYLGQKLNFLRKFLLPRLHHRLVFGRHHRAKLVRGDKMTRWAVRRWLRLPADCPNSAIHAPARCGGLEVASLEQLVSALKSKRLSLFTEGYAEDAPLASIPSVRSLMTYRFHKYSNSTREGLVEDLHSRLDTRGLKGYDHVPAVNSWLDYAPATLAGVEFQDAIRVRLGCMGTPARFSRGGATTQLMDTLRAQEESPVTNGELKRLQYSDRRYLMSWTPNWSLSFLAIQSKRRHLIAQRIGPVGSATQVPTDEEQVMAEPQPYEHIQTETSFHHRRPWFGRRPNRPS
ncbi:RSF1 [Acanthosepion pharaonis]|uniref:RSF1 n=1 Tax=Acanthosepion pharaonis TaxID=158019 RepID=A0A812DM93_ACAPH|nr:RSF1 [Sepia pharaonis]